ncbi:MAG TPA: zinc metallopeptidase [Candidatus Baltobacteraceae bacterium]|nr:zinc metallopeptidase [Candidatus Baltobacteraceae bacterium]
MLYGDWHYYLWALPGLLLGLWAQASLKSTFATYARVPTASGANGQQTAEALMQLSGVRVGVNSIPGFLTDYYDPRTKSINLSESSVQPSIASVAVVAHEMGHAVQDAQDYAPMRLRGAIVPAVQLSAWVGPLLFIGGMLLNSQSLVYVGIAAFAAAAFFSICTLPVEFNASSRALTMLQQANILQSGEIPPARKVLQAAALTYVAAAAQSLGTLLYYVSLASRRRS